MDTNWHTSSFSGKQGNCVQVKWLPGQGVIVRDSKLGDRSGIVRYTEDEWKAFIQGAKAGEFDI